MGYVEELEKQNEELRQLLAVHQDTMPKWHHFEEANPNNTTADYAYILDNRVFGFIKITDTGFYFKTFKSGANNSVMTIADVKKLIEQEYLDTFLHVVKP